MKICEIHSLFCWRPIRPEFLCGHHVRQITPGHWKAIYANLQFSELFEHLRSLIDDDDGRRIPDEICQTKQKQILV